MSTPSTDPPDVAILSPGDRRWEEFVAQLEGPEGCNFIEETAEAGATWRCGGGYSQDYARAILTAMGGIDVAGTLAFCSTQGGHCDCEILFNVDAPYRIEVGLPNRDEG